MGYVSVEVGKVFTNKGSVDIYISKYKWAIEILIDGNRLNEHWKRFQPGNSLLLTFRSVYDSVDSVEWYTKIYIISSDGKYARIPINDFLLVDIRQTVEVRKIYKNTWHIIPNKDFTSFKVKKLDINGIYTTSTILVKDNSKDLKFKFLVFSVATLSLIVFISGLVNVFLLFVIFGNKNIFAIRECFDQQNIKRWTNN